MSFSFPLLLFSSSFLLPLLYSSIILSFSSLFLFLGFVSSCYAASPVIFVIPLSFHSFLSLRFFLSTRFFSNFVFLGSLPLFYLSLPCSRLFSFSFCSSQCFSFLPGFFFPNFTFSYFPLFSLLPFLYISSHVFLPPFFIFCLSSQLLHCIVVLLAFVPSVFSSIFSLLLFL